jgi:hypothetical protein
MSEGTDSSVTSVENAKPEPIAPPTGGGKRKLWMMIAAVAVVAILVGTSAYVMFLAPLKTSMSPDEITIDAGQLLSLSVSVKKGIKTLTNDDAVTYRWRLNPDTIASFDLKSKPNVNVTAGIVEAQGTLTCEVTYKGEKVTISKQVTIKPPFLDQIIIAPSTKTLEKGTSKAFTASAVDSVGNPVLNLTYTWAVSSTLASINATTGLSVNLTAGSTDGNLSLTATAMWKDVSKTGTAKVIVGPLPPRKVDYLFYKMFDVPFNEWWNWRWAYYGTEKVMTTTYPYMFGFYAPPEGNVKVYANSRLNLTARNLTQISMGENPEFLPLHGSARGGTAVIDWYMQYLTSEEMKRYPSNTAGWLDGWVVSVNGTVTLDKEAALSVIKGLTTVSFDDFNTWWQTHGTEVSNDITGWLAAEAGGTRLNIYPAYDGNFQMLTGRIDGVKVGDKIVLTYDTVTWGMEAVIMRWLHEAFMPTEWWFEDMNFHAVIGPETARLDIDTAVAYAIYAFDTIQAPRKPCWVFEGLYQDVLPSAPPDAPYSDIDVYLDSEYLNGAPGNAFYNQMMEYDYTPGAWNLSANETLTLNYPGGQLPFLVHVPAEPGEIYANTTATLDTMSVKFSEPNSAENSEIAPGTVSVNNTARNVVFTGPIDMWDWANNQSSYDDLKDNWTRIDLLPHGIPWVELGMEHGLVVWPDEFVASDVPQMPVVGTPVNITISVKDNYGRAYPGFNGTIHFEANRTDIDLPPDYTFDPAVDGGKHEFTDGITFDGLGYYQINMSDVAVGGNATGSYTDIWVISEPEEVTGFQLSVLGVKGVVIKGLATSVEVTVFNQYPSPHNVFKGYNGTAMFSTDAPTGTYTLPPDATFSPENEGMVTLSGLLYNEMGTYILTVTDQLNTSATGNVTVVVSVPPEIDYRLYDMFEQRWGDWWQWRLIAYKTDIILNNKPHEYTMVYNPDMRNLQGIIYAPYRWNVTAKNMTTLNVHMPEFMPILGTPDVPGAAADMHIWFQYLDNASWNGYWVPTWSSNWNWSDAVMDAMMPAQFFDGYYIGTLYTISLNREAALEWLGMPTTDVPATWWTANRAAYMSAWQNWISNEGNIRLDIWPGYEWPYIDLATMMDLVEETDGKLTMKIAHFSWGFEVLTTRWLSEVALCNHEPYYEDFNLSAHYTEDYTNVSYDAVCQYNLHAVKANLTANSPAWVWEPQRIDYVAYSSTLSGYDSEYNPWEFRTYTSWNSGDGLFGTEVPYDCTPQWFNLTSYMTFEIQLPTQDNVIGYMGEKLATTRTSGAIVELKKGNYSAYENITVHGPMELGYNMTGLQLGAPNLWDYYNPGTKTLKMTGPIDFDNYRFWDGLLYHSAPWIEFNVANVTWGATTSLPISSGPGVEESAGSGAALSEMAALAAVLMATSLAVVALGAGARRKE